MQGWLKQVGNVAHGLRRRPRGALLNVQHLDVDEVGRSRPNLETRKVVAGCLRVAETPIRSCARGRSDHRSIPLDGYREHRTIDSGQARVLLQWPAGDFLFPDRGVIINAAEHERTRGNYSTVQVVDPVSVLPPHTRGGICI